MKRVLPPVPTEEAEQRLVVEWHLWAVHKWPELRLLHHVPNAGAGASRGMAGRMKALGAKPGIADLSLPVRRKHASGIYIEMKRVRGAGVTVEQRQVLDDVREQGFEAHVARGGKAAIEILQAYLNKPR